MQKFTEQKFNIGALKGISAKNIEEHLKLYAGYVKNVNGIMEMFDKYNTDPVSNSYVLGELGRRFSFEYNGMRNHEVYFSSLEGGPKSLNDSSSLKKSIAEAWGSFEEWLSSFKNMAATTRGIGWAVLWYDKKITILQGDSGKVLFDLCIQITEPAIFWLDGHYSEGITAKGDKFCPIYEELSAIFQSQKLPHVLLIDDARLFIGKNDYPTISDLTDFILRNRPEASVSSENDIIFAFLN